jgi:hypothetical protein
MIVLIPGRPRGDCDLPHGRAFIINDHWSRRSRLPSIDAIRVLRKAYSECNLLKGRVAALFGVVSTGSENGER